MKKSTTTLGTYGHFCRLALGCIALLGVAVSDSLAQTFTFTYGSVYDAHAGVYDIVVDNVKRYDEGNGTTYWGPTAANTLGTLIMRFKWAQPTESVYLLAWLDSYNFGGGASGQSYFYVSTDGVTYTKLIDNPTSPNLSSFKYYDDFLPDEYLGTTELYFKIELEQTVYPGSYALSQFSRKGSPANPFALTVTFLDDDLSRGLVAHYKLDGNATDSSGNGFDGTVIGGISATTDRFGTPNGAFSFDRNGYISLGSLTLLNGATEAAITGWVINKLNPGEQGVVIAAGDTRPGLDPFTFRFNGGQFVEAIFTDTLKGPADPDRSVGVEGVTGVPVTQDQWIPFVSQFWSVGGVTTYQLYLDGNLVIQETYNRSAMVSFDRPMPIEIGRINGYDVSRFRGAIDDLRIYNRALSASEIAALSFDAAMISPTSKTVSSSAQSYTISVTSNTSWTFSERLSWVSVSPSSGSGSGSVTVTVSENTSASSRSGTISIGSQSHSLTQQGAATALPNDNFSNPTSMTGTSGSLNGTNVGATREPGEPDHFDAAHPGSASVWFIWTAPSSGTAIFDVSNAFNSILHIYTGSTLASLQHVKVVAGAQYMNTAFQVTAGTTYRVVIDTWDGATGSYDFTWDIVPYAGDLDQNGCPDVIWQSGNFVSAWLMDSATTVASAVILSWNSGNWTVVGTGDLDCDGSTDIVWQSGDSVAVWLMDGLTLRTSMVLTSRAGGWHVAAIGDLNNDGIDDIVWQKREHVAAWLMDGHGNMQTLVILTHAAGSWQVKAVADIDKDDKTDILWQSGSIAAAWLMDGPNTKLAAPIISANTGRWRIVGTADYDKNGSADIIWQNGKRVALWLLDGYTNLLSAPELTSNAGTWKVVGPK